jgi:hypothetical protein
VSRQTEIGWRKAWQARDLVRICFVNAFFDCDLAH